ncbi:MAG TPA: CoA-binding protein [Elusimicrobia bacterium]|nr:CoA-binding protein [Elusimicrobiota bacterium]
MEENITKDFLVQKNIAVAGSFRSKEKVAYRIFLQLKEKGYNVFPVNPSISELEGVKVYGSVLEISQKVDAVDIVTPPAVTEKIVEECKKKGIKYVWMQPGAESENAIKFCERNNIKVIYNTCLMVEAG